ncbi:DNA2/NAM7 family helicase [Romeria aff. gracilis LEGE 07310]|uniref:DNA2/NAM7 family helicase n=1 Tax=Vasconcelosia minhoensis LEGE 07310 TaxID=915328 RepID=A0A8J7AQ94_9CYAN|nr:DNA2/NAM7 family helicase [Romeria gracilis]MBE9079200.1 DNA2/NAM7 family helicase [Romeria aff. gracilis LEGE 07310]
MAGELARGHQRLGKAFADEIWWERPDAVIEMSTPWVDRELDDARSQLFIAALRVHQAFIEQSADKLRRNIELWLDLIQTGKFLGQTQKRTLILWQTAFLVIPVISTTFASIARLFKQLDRETLGWLLVDEAGQAVPQAAIGALWRAKRAVVVGDPLQLEPIFTPHPNLVEGLRHHFQLEDCWNPHSYSAQGLADRINPFGTELRQRDKPLWVGCPLRVHRRCIEPMFSLSNEIAYGGKMVLATKPPEGILFPAGVSRWIHTSGECEGKHWVPNQGEQVLHLLAQITSQSAELSEVFIISPFREVSNALKRVLSQRTSEWAPPRLNVRQKQTWLDKSVGTIHTFQGR